MAITYRTATNFTAGNGTSVATVAKPTGTALDDLLVASLYMESTGLTVVIASTGDTWVPVHDIVNTGTTPDVFHYVWIAKVANTSSTIGVTWGGGSFWRDFCVAGFVGVDTTTPQDAAATEATGTTATPTAPGIAEVTAASWLVMCETNFDGNARSASSLTERIDDGNVSLFAAENATATDKVCTISSATWTAIMLRLRPAGAAAVIPPGLGTVVGMNTTMHSMLP